MRIVADGKWYGAPGFARQHDALITLRWDGIRFWQRNGPMKSPSVVVRQQLSCPGPIRLSPDDSLGVFGNSLLDLRKVWEAFDHPGPKKPAQVQAEPIPGLDPGWGRDWLELSPDGRRLFVNEYGDGDWHLWDLADQRRHPRFGSVPGCHLAVSPDGNLVAVDGFFASEVNLIDVETGTRLATLHHPNNLLTLAFSPCPRGAGQLLATMTRGHSKVRLFDVANRTCLAEFKAFPGRAVGMCFHPLGRFLIAAGKDGQIRCYDTLTLRETERLDWQVGKLKGLAISPDGLTAAVIGQERGVVIWDLDDLLPM